jgi:hypothetical protein
MRVCEVIGFAVLPVRRSRRPYGPIHGSLPDRPMACGTPPASARTPRPAGRSKQRAWRAARQLGLSRSFVGADGLLVLRGSVCPVFEVRVGVGEDGVDLPALTAWAGPCRAGPGRATRRVDRRRRLEPGDQTLDKPDHPGSGALSHIRTTLPKHRGQQPDPAVLHFPACCSGLGPRVSQTPSETRLPVSCASSSRIRSATSPRRPTTKPGRML